MAVIHVRGVKGDSMGSALHRKCRELLRQELPRDQLLHLHCCQAGLTDVRAWLEAFPRTCFGFTGGVRQFGNVVYQRGQAKGMFISLLI